MNVLDGTVLDGDQLAAVDALVAALGLEKSTTAWIRVEGRQGGLRVVAEVKPQPNRATQLLVWRSP